MGLFRAWAVTCMSAALSAAAGAQTASINGTVYDSLRSGPLGRAVVVATPVANARDTAFHSAITDDNGRFTISGLTAGRYELSVDHSAMDSIGVHVPDQQVDLHEASRSTVRLALPSAATLKRLLCDDGPTAGTGAMVGVVRRVDGTPVRGAKVIFNWSDFDVDRRTLRVASRTESASAVTNDFGVYKQCGLPVARSMLVQAQLPASVQSGILEESIGNGGVLVRDFRVSNADASAAGDQALSGTVLDVSNRPIAGAQVSLPSLERSAVTNERGEFRLAGLPAGTQGVEVIALGYYPRSVRVEIDGAGAPMQIRMERTAVVLDSMRAIAARSPVTNRLAHREFDQRAKNGMGSFLTSAQIDSIRPVTMVDAFRRMLGVHLLVPDRPGEYIVTLKPLKHARLPCIPRIYLDGVIIDEETLVNLTPSTIHGIEAHSVATAPVKYNVDECGGIFVWTR